VDESFRAGTRTGLTRAGSLNTWFIRNETREVQKLTSLNERLTSFSSTNCYSSLNHVTDLPDAVFKWTLCTQKVR